MQRPETFENVQSSVLRRLLDDDPADQRPEPPSVRFLDPEQLRKEVMEDLRQLLNTIAWPESEVLALRGSGRRERRARDWLNYLSPEEYPEVADSVLNFGVPPSHDYWESGAGVLRLQRLLTKAIERFEPRITLRPNGITVLGRQRVEAHPNILAIRMEGTLWAQPTPIELVLRSEMDVESRETRLSVLEESR